MAASPLGPGPQFALPPYGPSASASPGPDFYNNGYMASNPPHGNNGFFAPQYGIPGFNIPSGHKWSPPPQESHANSHPPPVSWPSRAVAVPSPTANPLPPVPGLPARPSFNSLPNFTREEMAQLHGAGQPQPGLNVSSKRSMPNASFTDGNATTKKDFSASLTDMINQEAKNAEDFGYLEFDDQAPTVATSPAAALPKSHPKKSKTKRDNQVLKVKNKVVPPEELKAADRKFTNTFTVALSGTRLSAASNPAWYNVFFR